MEAKLTLTGTAKITNISYRDLGANGHDIAHRVTVSFPDGETKVYGELVICAPEQIADIETEFIVHLQRKHWRES